MKVLTSCILFSVATQISGQNGGVSGSGTGSSASSQESAKKETNVGLGDPSSASSETKRDSPFGLTPLVTKDWDCWESVRIHDEFSWSKYRLWMQRILKSDVLLLQKGRIPLDFFRDWVAILHSWEALLDECPIGVTASVFLFYLWKQWGFYDRGKQVVILKNRRIKRPEAIASTEEEKCSADESVVIVNGTIQCPKDDNGSDDFDVTPPVSGAKVNAPSNSGSLNDGGVSLPIEISEEAVPAFLTDSTSESAVVEYLSYLLHQKNVDFVVLAGTQWPIFSILCELDVKTDVVDVKKRKPDMIGVPPGKTILTSGGEPKKPVENWLPAAIPTPVVSTSSTSKGGNCDYIGTYSAQYLQRKIEQFIGFSKASPITEAWLFLRDLDPIMAGLLKDVGFVGPVENGFSDLQSMVKKLKLDTCPSAGLAIAGVLCILSYLAAPQNFEYFAGIANVVLQFRIAELFSSGFADTQKWNVFCILKSLATFKTREYKGQFDSSVDLIDYSKELAVNPASLHSVLFANEARTSLHQRQKIKKYVHSIRRHDIGKINVVHLTAVGGDEFSLYLPAYTKRFFQELKMENLGVACLDESTYSSCTILSQMYATLICLDAVSTDVIFGKHKWIPIFLAMGLAVLWLDFDVYLFRNPTRAILGTTDVSRFLATASAGTTADIWVQEHYDGMCLNSGVFFVLPNKKTLEFFLEFLRWVHQSVFSDNQNGFDAFIGHSMRESFVPRLIRGSLNYKLLDVEKQFISAEGHYVGGEAKTPEKNVQSKDWNEVVLFHFWQSDYESSANVNAGEATTAQAKIEPVQKVDEDVDYDDDEFPEETAQKLAKITPLTPVGSNDKGSGIFATAPIDRPKLKKAELFSAFYGRTGKKALPPSQVREEILKFKWGPRPRNPPACSVLTAGSQTIFAAQNPGINLGWTVPDPAATKREQEFEQGMELVFKSMMDDDEDT